MPSCARRNNPLPTKAEETSHAEFMADLSIIIVTRNTCALTRAAVRSVMESKDALTKEIVVVDNGSSDGTPAMLSGNSRR